MKCKKKKGLGPLPSEENLDLGQKHLEDEVWSEWERFKEVKSLERLRDIEQNEIQIALREYIEAQ